MSFRVLNAGVFTLLQDRGRFKYSHLGVTNSGFLDEYAAFTANRLLDNNLDTNALEIAFPNLILEATKNTTISITGAYCDFFINDILENTWQTHSIKKGDILKIGKFHSGQRVYLAVKNGFDTNKEFGSNSTTLKEQFGKKLEKNDILPFHEHSEFKKRRLHEKFLPKYENNLVLRVLLSYQEEEFSKEEKEKFFCSEYEITPDFNRMACKLKGEAISSNLDGVISEPIAYGAIQIPKDGQPIILLKERQTIGGYPKIGTVLAIDCFKLAQMKIGSKVKFEQIDIQTAQKKLRDFYSIFS